MHQINVILERLPNPSVLGKLHGIHACASLLHMIVYVAPLPHQWNLTACWDTFKIGRNQMQASANLHIYDTHVVIT